MWRKQAFACSQDGPFAVALDAASLENEIEMAFIRPFQNVQLCHSSANLVIEFGGELLAPAVELEVEQMGAVIGKQCDEAMVASPSVVGWRFAERDAGEFPCSQGLFEQLANMGRLRCYYNNMYARRESLRHINIAAVHSLQNGMPISTGMRPCELHGTLFVPFGWQV